MLDPDAKEIIERLGEHLRDSSPRSRFPWEAVATILAIIGMVITVTQSWATVTQSWAIMGKRLDDLEASRVEQQKKLDDVPRLKWTSEDVIKRLDSLDARMGQLERQGTEVHDTLMRLGLNVKATRQ
jgi:hypothetical protein